MYFCSFKPCLGGSFRVFRPVSIYTVDKPFSSTDVINMCFNFAENVLITKRSESKQQEVSIFLLLVSGIKYVKFAARSTLQHALNGLERETSFKADVATMSCVARVPWATLGKGRKQDVPRET